jgi:hypothetical protein
MLFPPSVMTYAEMSEPYARDHVGLPVLPSTVALDTQGVMDLFSYTPASVFVI